MPYDMYGSGDMGVVDLSSYDKVIIGNDQEDAFYWALDANRVWFEDYMNAGGCLLVGCAASCVSIIEEIAFPGGFVVRDNGLSNNWVSIMWPAHPVFNDPLSVTHDDLQNRGASSHGRLADLPAGAVMRVENTGILPGTPVAISFEWGAGGGYAAIQPIEYMGSSHPYTVNLTLYTCTDLTPVERATWGTIKAMYR